jgi:hypothetical protein
VQTPGALGEGCIDVFNLVDAAVRGAAAGEFNHVGRAVGCGGKSVWGCDGLGVRKCDGDRGKEKSGRIYGRYVGFKTSFTTFWYAIDTVGSGSLVTRKHSHCPHGEVV